MFSRIAAAALFLLAALAGVVVLLAPAAPAPIAAPPAAPAPVVEPVEPVDPFVASLVGPGTDLAPGQADELLALAARVCDGFAADVPVVVLADALTVSHGFTDEEARTFVNAAGVQVCYPDH